MRSPGGPADCRHGDAPFEPCFSHRGDRAAARAGPGPLLRADDVTHGRCVGFPTFCKDRLATRGGMRPPVHRGMSISPMTAVGRKRRDRAPQGNDAIGMNGAVWRTTKKIEAAKCGGLPAEHPERTRSGSRSPSLASFMITLATAVASGSLRSVSGTSRACRSADRSRRYGRTGGPLQLQRLHDERELVGARLGEVLEHEVLEQMDT